MKDSSLDFPVILLVKRMSVIGFDSGVGLEIFLLETLEMLMKPKSEMVDWNNMKDEEEEGELELGAAETFLIVMLLFDEIKPVTTIDLTTERS